MLPCGWVDDTELDDGRGVDGTAVGFATDTAHASLLGLLADGEVVLAGDGWMRKGIEGEEGSLTVCRGGEHKWCAPWARVGGSQGKDS